MSKDTSSPEYQELKTELRSLLISSQQGCTEQQVIKDYAAYNGSKPVPFRAMGYATLLDLLRSMPDVARIDTKRGPPIIHGVANSETVHIKDMVMKQRSKRGPPRRNYSTYQNTGASANYRQRLPNQYSYYPQYHQVHNAVPYGYPVVQPMHTAYPSMMLVNPVRPNPIEPNRPAAAKSVASFPPREASTASLPVPPPAVPATGTTPTLDDSSSTIDDDTTNVEDDELIAYDQQQASIHGEKIILLRKRIRQLLMKFTKGVWLANIQKLYQKSFGEEFNLEQYQLKNFMAFFECISDFVDSRRDPNDTTDRILLLKPNYAEAVKREQQTSTRTTSTQPVLPQPTTHQETTRAEENGHRTLNSSIPRPLIDRSAFVPFDFHYKRSDWGPNQPFDAFLGDVNDPWSICIGNMEFMPKREQMMIELQDHYNQSSDQPIYIIPFEQLEINLSCVYYHSNCLYYRAFITQMDHTEENDVILLKVYLVDYGVTVESIRHDSSSTTLKFLHKDFSSLNTEVYDCRLANLAPSTGSEQWPEEARQFILDLCQNKSFVAQINGYLECFFCVFLWLDDNPDRSVNEQLIRSGLAVEVDDKADPQFKTFAPVVTQTSSVLAVNGGHTYIDEKLFSRQEQENVEYQTRENRFKHFIISIEHAYYFVKQPFNGGPCLPCFEVARLLRTDESAVAKLNLVRKVEIPFTEGDRELFRDLRNLPESSKCPHLNCADSQSAFFLYDLNSVRDYLKKIKFQEGDVIDALRQESENYQRPGYWNEKKSSYICEIDPPSHTEDLYRRKDLFTFRRDQLQSSSSNHLHSDEMRDIQGRLDSIDQQLDSINHLLPSNASTRVPPSTIRNKTSREKIRETRFRIARPFDQQFGLNVCFEHGTITEATVDEYDEDLEDRFQDLHRISKNVLQFFHLEPNLIHEQDRVVLNEVELILTDLLADIAFDRRIETYNRCLEVIQRFHPVIQSYMKRGDMMDVI